jgi:proteasome lid subunit RPN8/RPN11
MTFSEAQKTIIAQRAKLSMSEEICGFVLRRVRRCSGEGVKQMPNIAADRVNEFELSSTAVQRAVDSGKLLAVWHSHPLESQPAMLSAEDIAASKARGIPYLVHHPVFEQWDYFDPAGTHPFPFEVDAALTPDHLEYYLGRRFVWNRSDCASLVIDYYKGMLGIDLLDYPRGGTDPTCVASEDWDVVQQNYAANGFRKLGRDELPQNGDLAVACLAGRNPHHFVILHDVSANVGLHILENQVSAKVFYGEAFQNRTRLILRHKTLEPQQ